MEMDMEQFVQVILWLDFNFYVLILGSLMSLLGFFSCSDDDDDDGDEVQILHYLESHRKEKDTILNSTHFIRLQ